MFKKLIPISRYISCVSNRNYHCLKLLINNVTGNNVNTTFTINCSINNSQEIITNTRQLSLSPNNYAKSRDKGKDKKKKKVKVEINEMEMAELINIDKYKRDLERVLEDLRNDLVKNITVRSSSGSIEELKVIWDEKTYCIQDLAQIARKPKMIVLNCSIFPQAMKPILDVLNNSGMNVNPQQEGTTIYIPTPKVTKEHREQLSKNAKQLLIKHKDNFKDFQNKQLRTIKDKDHISLDLARKVEEQVKALCSQYVSEAEKLAETKQKEVLGE